MNNPNPLIPQGLLPEHQPKGNPTVRIAVFTIVAIHAVFFAGLLMQGCSKTKTTTESATNDLDKLDTNYYQVYRDLPAPSTNLPEPEPSAPIPSQTSSPAITGPTYTPAPAPAPVQTPAIAPAPGLDPAQSLTPTLETKEYTIARGETISGIARAHKVSISAIVRMNPGLEPSKVRAGQKITIPLSNGGNGALSGSRKSEKESSAAQMYTVKAGDTLTKIARLHGTTVKALKAANNLKTDRLLVGQKLKLPEPAAAPEGPESSAPSNTNFTGQHAKTPPSIPKNSVALRR